MWIWENKDTLNPELSIKSLLFTMVKNKSLNLINHHDVQRKVHQEIIDNFQEAFEEPDLYLNEELHRLYRNALTNMPKDFREAFELNRKHHLTHREIAQELGVSAQTVNYRISQALKLLRTGLKDYLPLLLCLLHF
ncbi:RNA polymerase ECF-type sigma factor [gut metagenome]|uniref:RNA polymerase ECF-type sigma factor n=1 Tax=gut metagenome TaxID=749906 RepID=J9GXH5_9ZZZZ